MLVLHLMSSDSQQADASKKGDSESSQSILMFTFLSSSLLPQFHELQALWSFRTWQFYASGLTVDKNNNKGLELFTLATKIMELARSIY